MIKKETFIKIIDMIKEQNETNNKVGEALELVCDSWVMYGLKDKYKDALMLLLEEIFNDTDDWIGWWLYEDVEKVVTYTDSDEKDILDTPEQLYDFLIK